MKSGFPPTENVWTFDFRTSAWSHANTPPPEGPPHGEGSSAIYDPATGLVWYGEGRNSNPDDGWGLWAWDPDERTWTHHTRESVLSRATGCLDTRRGLLIVVGGGDVSVFDVRTGTPELVQWETTGDRDIVDAAAPGGDYDPVLDRAVAWEAARSTRSIPRRACGRRSTRPARRSPARTGPSAAPATCRRSTRSSP
jgi:hypothetical protein